MSQKEIEEALIRNYQRDESLMVHIFAQWCVNHDLDPAELYFRAYPEQGQGTNQALQYAFDLVVPKEEAGDIPDETLLGILELFGNEALAVTVTEEIDKRKRRLKLVKP